MTLRPEPYAGYTSDRVFDALEALSGEAPSAASRWRGSRSRGCWRRRGDGVIVGPGRAEHLAPAIEALDIPLSPADRDQLTEVFS